jgi:hypothetical protein
MSIRPILFNTEMARAVLGGRKSCTRRIIKPQPDKKHIHLLGYVNGSTGRKNIGSFGFGANEHGGAIQYVKPPYQPGDILYVRETWERFECWNCDGDERGNCPKEPKKSVLDKTCGCYMYRATDEIRGDAKWHPSIHMPKEAARIWLKVTDVRVERLQDITEDGCIAEGIYPSNCRGCNATFGCDVCPDEGYDEFDKFMEIWDSTIKKTDIDRYGWNANPWVWVIEFERCERGGIDG